MTMTITCEPVEQEGVVASETDGLKENLGKAGLGAKALDG